MDESEAAERLARHGLVMAIWIPSVFVSTALSHMGIIGGGAWWVAAGFAAIIIAFIAHIILNAVTGTSFTAGETALGGAVFVAAVICYFGALLIGDEGVRTAVLMPVGIGLALLICAVIVYLVIAYGPRKAFEKFDVIRDNNLRAASRLPHRGGRR